jgi:enoyl-CoA hydratase/carnithine racemase
MPLVEEIAMESGTERMIARREGTTGWMLFNNPARHNAVSLDMWEAVPRILDAFERNEDIRSIVVAGVGGRAFVSGADISEFAERRSSRETIAHYNAVADRAGQALTGCRKPTIAMIQGYCIGGGVGIALACDLRIASDNSRFGVPAARLGIGYSYGGVARLSDIVGPAFAKEIFFTARQFDATEAREMGLVNRVRPAAELDAYVRQYAEAIGVNAPLTIAAAKLCVDEHLKDAEERDLAACHAAVDACSVSADYAEGRTAFMDKRKPAFTGG